jgi:hypothetical protein
MPQRNRYIVLFSLFGGLAWAQNFLPNPRLTQPWTPWVPITGTTVTQAAAWGPRLDPSAGIQVKGRFFGQGNNVILFDALGVRDSVPRTGVLEMRATFLNTTFTTGPITFPVPKKTGAAVMGPPRNVAWVGPIAPSGNGISEFVVETHDDFGVVVRNVHSFFMLDNHPSKVVPGGAAGYMEEGITRDAVNLNSAYVIQAVSLKLNDLAASATGFSTSVNLVVGGYAGSTLKALQFAIKGAKPIPFAVQAYDFKAGSWVYLMGSERFGVVSGVAAGTSFANHSILFPTTAPFGSARFVGPASTVLIRFVPNIVSKTPPGNAIADEISIRAFRLVP